MVQPVTRWKEFKDVLKELSKEDNKNLFSTIVIDTADLAFDACEKFICGREGVDQIGDIPYGAGYKMLRNEFNDALRSIPMMDYGLVMISHAVNSTFTDENGAEFSKIVPTLPKAPRAIVLSMSDVIGFAKNIENESGSQSVLFLRGTPRFEAGSRFKYTPDYIKFDYESLVDAISDAIEKEAEVGGAVTDEAKNVYEVPVEKSFGEVKQEIDSVIATLVKQDDTPENQQVAALKIKKVVETHLGKGKTIKDSTEDQRDHLELILDDLKTL